MEWAIFFSPPGGLKIWSAQKPLDCWTRVHLKIYVILSCQIVASSNAVDYGGVCQMSAHGGDMVLPKRSNKPL